MAIGTSVWRAVAQERLTADALMKVFNNEIGALSVPGFAPADACVKIADNIRAAGVEYYAGVYPLIGRIGITQFEARESEAQKCKYFDDAVAAHKQRRRLMGTCDLLELTRRALAAVWPAPVELATEPATGRQYFAGLIRLIEEALLHCDWAPLDAPEWAIGSVTAQCSWNIYCQAPRHGGETTIFRRPWTEDAERFHVAGSYGYEASLVHGVEATAITPRVGDLVIFNSRNFHRVDRSSRGRDRISVTSFIGRMPTGELVLWS